MVRFLKTFSMAIALVSVSFAFAETKTTTTLLNIEDIIFIEDV